MKRYKRKYVPQPAFCISCLFIELANKTKITWNCSGNILNGVRKFRTDAENLDYQTCYFKVINNKQLFNVYISKRINNSEDNDDIQFKIIHLKSSINNEEAFDATQEIQSVNKQNVTGIVEPGNSRKTDRSSFSVSIKPPISERKSVRRKRPRFLLKW